MCEFNFFRSGAPKVLLAWAPSAVAALPQQPYSPILIKHTIGDTVKQAQNVILTLYKVSREVIGPISATQPAGLKSLGGEVIALRSPSISRN